MQRYYDFFILTRINKKKLQFIINYWFISKAMGIWSLILSSNDSKDCRQLSIRQVTPPLNIRILQTLRHIVMFCCPCPCWVSRHKCWKETEDTYNTQVGLVSSYRLLLAALQFSENCLRLFRLLLAALQFRKPALVFSALSVPFLQRQPATRHPLRTSQFAKSDVWLSQIAH